MNLKTVEDTELYEQIKSFRPFLYFHGYQPPRRVVLEDKTIFDITGENEYPGGYNERIWRRCYFPMTYPLQQWGVENPQPILSHDLVQGHLYGTTRDWIREHHPKNYQAFVGMLKKTPIPIVDSYIHAILPLLPEEAQSVLIEIGIRAWEQDVGLKLRNINKQPIRGFGFWPAELGINHNTVEILAKHGVRFLILNIDQLEVNDFSPVYRVKTKTHDVLVIAYNGKDFAQKLAFSNIINADDFANKIRKFKINIHSHRLQLWTWETFGEWRGLPSFWFLNFFVHKTVSSDEMYRDPIMIKEAKIRDATSWSCEHALGRWTGKNDCSCDSANARLRQRKQALYDGLWENLHKTIVNLNKNQADWQEAFINFFVNSRREIALGHNLDFKYVSAHHRENFKRLLINLIGFTSCGWFYSGELERQIPENSLRYLEGQL